MLTDEHHGEARLNARVAQPLDVARDLVADRARDRLAIDDRAVMRTILRPDRVGREGRTLGWREGSC